MFRSIRSSFVLFCPLFPPLRVESDLLGRKTKMPLDIAAYMFCLGSAIYPQLVCFTREIIKEIRKVISLVVSFEREREVFLCVS